MSQWWLSFVDPDKSLPPEEQAPGTGGFLGVVIVEESTFLLAVTRSHMVGANPGGQISGVEVPEHIVYPPEVLDRLLLLPELEAMENGA